MVGPLFFNWDSGPIGARHMGPRVLFLLQGPFLADVTDVIALRFVHFLTSLEAPPSSEHQTTGQKLLCKGMAGRHIA